MRIRSLHLRILTEKGLYGFSFSFSKNLTVIRGNNSSGKSTFFNTLLYSLGMEELVGGKGSHVLPYAVRDYFEEVGEKVIIQTSETLVEIENKAGDVVTLRRSIKDEAKDCKLVEIYRASAIIGLSELKDPIATYLHDPGSAQRESGFYHFMERFLEIDLPRVSTTAGGETKLYLQSIFAAHAVEQKRGWTDYIANLPFYGIRDARTRVTEYILGLDVFETISLRNRLNAEASKIDQEWRQTVDELLRESDALGLVVDGVPYQPKINFTAAQVTLQRSSESGFISLENYIKLLLSEHEKIGLSSQVKAVAGARDSVNRIEALDTEAQVLSVRHERISSELALQRESVSELETLFTEAQADLERNKSAQKLHALGAKHAIQLAVGQCPTCHQAVNDTLFGSAAGLQMDLRTNIGYLEAQARMLRRQIAGTTESIRESSALAASFSAQLASTRDQAAAIRRDVGATATQSRASVRRQVQIEIEIGTLERLQSVFEHHLDSLKKIAARLIGNQLQRRDLPRAQYTPDDEQRISIFEKNFRANIGSFGYESVSNIGEIHLNRDSLLPELAQIELREIIKKSGANIRADSSASDFVRLIWGYLLALHQTSSNSHTLGHHLGILLFDEPGQHSMRTESQRELLIRLAEQPALQSIVAASFDESESVFQDVTDNVQHELIRWEGKLIQKVEEVESGSLL